MQNAMTKASLYRTYRYQFAMGAAVRSSQLRDESYAELIRRHFNSMTAENEMKPMHILDHAGTLEIGDGIHTAQDFTKTDEILAFARDHGIRVRFHVLCWHGQTPFWFFMKDWQDVPFETLIKNQFRADYASREMMLQRQEAYIRDVMTHVNTCFPGVVYCWDVVNEAIDPEQGAEGGYRTKSPWYMTVGEEFVPAAFRAARKYQAPGQLLFYNDYNCYHEDKLEHILNLLKKLKAENLVDGMGMQAHLQMDTPAVEECEKAARAYGALGLSLQATELDIHCPDGSEEGQRELARRYRDYFDMLVRLKREGIDINSATFWGVTDKDSWLPGFRKSDSYPLLFTADMDAKAAFDAVLHVPEDYELIRLNQAGYAEGMPVCFAVLSGEKVTLRNEEGNILKEMIPEPVPDEASGDCIAMVDAGLLPAGTYRVECGVTSRSLKVSGKPWRKVTNALIKGLYYQRCGVKLDRKYAGVYTHEACHTAPARFWENKDCCKRISGGWHDAGDYGRYVSPGAVTAAHLLYSFILFPEGCSDDLNIPESGNGVPDILNETRWELEWILKMQREDGAFYHKLTKDHFAPFIMPETDLDPEYITPVSSLATADAAAVCALASDVYRPYDSLFADRLLEAAVLAGAWLQKHPDMLFENPEGIHTGPYGDRSDGDERFWAACELYAATGEEKYLTEAQRLYSDGMNVIQFGWVDVSGMGALCCLYRMQEHACRELYDAVKSNLVNRAGWVLGMVKTSGYRTALKPDLYTWGSVLPLMSNTLAMILCYDLTGNEDMKNGALNQVHYALGMNALNISFITGFGERRVMFPHHRPSEADGVAEPVPGLISGGPNHRWNYETTKQILPEGTKPAKFFLDETPSADTNEIAIYWNSMAIMVFAFFNAIS